MRDRAGARRAVLAVLALALPGCEAGPPIPVTVTDSAGVRITMSADVHRTFAVVDPEPVLSLGGPDATGPAQLYRVQDVHLDHRGVLWVADGQSGELRLFGADGSHLKTLGGRGEGPGEYVRIRLLGSFRGDSVAVWDDRTARLTVYGPGGELARTVAVGPGQGTLPEARDVYPDGSLLGVLPRILQAGRVEAGALLPDTVRLARIDPEAGTTEPQAAPAGRIWLWTGRSQLPIPFTENAGYDLRGDALHVVSGPRFRIRVFRDGALTGIYGVRRGPRPVGPDAVRAYREYVESWVPESARSDWLDALDHPAVPELLPGYATVLVSAAGNVWARVYDPLGGSTWEVFGPDRRFLGRVEAPAGLRVTRVTEERLVGIWWDELQVEHVRVYRLRRGRGDADPEDA